MNILFGNKDIDAIRQENRFTVLELDTIQASPDHPAQTAYCVLSDVPITEMAELDAKVRMHHDMMHFYRTQQWKECRDILNFLRGSWNGEVDTFYNELELRLNSIENSSITAEWDGVYRPWRN